MWRARGLVLSTLLLQGCTMDFGVFEGAPDASVARDAGDAAAAGEAGSSSSSSSGSGSSSGSSSSSGGSSSSGSGSSSGGGVPDGGSCSGADPIACLVCADGGPPALVCGPANPSASCLSGNYAHCPCQQDGDCPGGNMRCSNNVCTSCGEPQFSHSRCNGGGTCCKTGANVGTCSC